MEILPNGKLTVDKPEAKIGFLYVEIYGKDAGRIVFDQTVFGLDRCKKCQRNAMLSIRRQICEKLGGVDVTHDLAVKR